MKSNLVQGRPSVEVADLLHLHIIQYILRSQKQDLAPTPLVYLSNLKKWEIILNCLERILASCIPAEQWSKFQHVLTFTAQSHNPQNSLSSLVGGCEMDPRISKETRCSPNVTPGSQPLGCWTGYHWSIRLWRLGKYHPSTSRPCLGSCLNFPSIPSRAQVPLRPPRRRRQWPAMPPADKMPLFGPSWAFP